MSDLRTLIQFTAHELASSPANRVSTNDAVDNAAIVSAIRSKRRRTTALSIAASFAGIAAIGATALFLMDTFRDPDPAIPPAPSLSASPAPETSASPSPTPSIDPDERAQPGFVTSAADLPSAEPLPAGAIESAEPGWVLGVYRPSVLPGRGDPELVEDPEQLSAAEYQVIYLASPDGTRYQVLELPPEPLIAVKSWKAGDTTAIAWLCQHNCWSGRLVTIDLLTGEITQFPGIDSDEVRHVATYPGGTSLWTDENGLWIIDNGAAIRVSSQWDFNEYGRDLGLAPSGEFVIVGFWEDSSDAPSIHHLGALNLRDGTVAEFPLPEGDHACNFERWLGTSSALIDCVDRLTESTQGWQSDFATGAVEPVDGYVPWYLSLDDDEPGVRPEFTLGENTWVGHYTTSAASRDNDYGPAFGISVDGVVRRISVTHPGKGEVPRIHALDRVGELIYLHNNALASDVDGLWHLSVYDASNDSVTVLFPEPPGGPATEVEGGYEFRPIGLDSWAVGH